MVNMTAECLGHPAQSLKISGKSIRFPMSCNTFSTPSFSGMTRGSLHCLVPVVPVLELLPEVTRDEAYSCSHHRANERQNEWDAIAQRTCCVRSSHDGCKGTGPLCEAEGRVCLAETQTMAEDINPMRQPRPAQSRAATREARDNACCKISRGFWHDIIHST